MVGNESQFIVHDGGASALGVGFREADPRPWKMMLWLQRVEHGGGCRPLLGEGGVPARRLRCRGEVYFATGIENGE